MRVWILTLLFLTRVTHAATTSFEGTNRTIIYIPSPETNYDSGVNLSSGLSKWRLMSASVTTSRVPIVCIGDSITDGYNTTPATGVGRSTNGWVGQLRSRVQATYGGSGLGFLGAHRIGASYEPYNFIFTGSWTVGEVGNYTGGPFGSGRWGTGYALTVELTNVTCSAFEIFYTECQYTGDSFKVDIDGVGVITNSYSAQTPPISKSLLVNSNLSGQKITLHCPSAAKYLMFNGIALYNSTNGVFVHNIGKSGSTIGNFQPGSEFITGINPALTILMLDANDSGGHVDTNTYGASMSNVFRFCTNGSIIVLNGPTNTSATIPPQMSYWSTGWRIGSNYNAAYLSVWAHWGSNVNLAYQTDVHPNTAGHTNIGYYLYTKLVP